MHSALAAVRVFAERNHVMNILVINAGSSSLKYQLLNLETHVILAKGICECVGDKDSFIKHGIDENEIEQSLPLDDHNAAMAFVLEALTSGPNKAIDSLDEIDAVGHRIVQGGKYFDRSVLIDDDVQNKIDELAELAPLHNKAAIMGIDACRKLLPDKPMVAVFDSAYFQTLEEKAYMYPIPYEMYEKYAIRKYGAHGTSHRYIAARAAKFLGKPLDSLKIITCHLGNGCSMTAIKDGIAVDTSMGLTPLDGLMMGTRSGAIDPTVVSFIAEHENISAADVNTMLNKKSGLLGISGVSNDMRTVQAAAENGNKKAQLAIDMYIYCAKKFIGQYMAVLGGVDAIVFSAGIGENSPAIRAGILDGLEAFGIVIDADENATRGGEHKISAASSTVDVLVIPTDEEYMIAQDVHDIVSNL